MLFDSNAYDAILAAGDLPRLQDRIVAGELAVVTTPIQEDEIRQIRNPARQRALLALYRALGGTRIDPGAVIAADTTYMARDEMLLRIAAACCDWLVSDDKALAAADPGRVIPYAAFSRRLALRA
ncbi:MAG TPA: hypothetical protein VF194_00395 [Ferrovibrio sp.]|uniref:hypothetical protein n=1 Tax=Ferrovibrio sp. TaxID=1917215 RepID=UPI002ED17FD0